jgi:hypothetical protein
MLSLLLVNKADALVKTFGFVSVSNVLPANEVRKLISTLGQVNGAGRRGVMAIPAVAKLANSTKVLDLVRPHLGPSARPVRAIYFDKSGSSGNWGVSWHQDVTIAVRARADVAGFGPWSEKDGVPHVQAPVQVLEQMITFRLHLDNCGEHKDALRVLVGSHRFGRLEGSTLAVLARECPEIVCHVPAGGALIMRPLLVHASSRSRSGGHRRVLHIEYAGFELPQPLQWHEAG